MHSLAIINFVHNAWINQNNSSLISQVLTLPELQDIARPNFTSFRWAKLSFANLRKVKLVIPNCGVYIATWNSHDFFPSIVNLPILTERSVSVS